MVAGVLAQDVRFEGWDTVDWLRLLSLFEVPSEGPGGLFVVHDGRTVKKLLHTRAGRLPPGQPWGGPLDALASEQQAGWVVGFHVGALEEIMERLGARVVASDGLIEQVIKGIEIVREMAEEGAVAAWPAKLRGLPVPSAQVVVGALDALCPPGKSVAVGLFEGGELWTGAALRRGPRGFERIVGPEPLRPGIGLLSGDFRRDYTHMMRAVERQVGPLSVGLFTEVKTLRRLVAEARPGSWARAVAVRDVIVAPMPASVALPLGVDAARGLSQAGLVALGRLDLDRRLASTLAALRSPERRGTLLLALRQLLSKLSG